MVRQSNRDRFQNAKLIRSYRFILRADGSHALLLIKGPQKLLVLRRQIESAGGLFDETSNRLAFIFCPAFGNPLHCLPHLFTLGLDRCHLILLYLLNNAGFVRLDWFYVTPFPV